jgi:SAM-dependent methyltransferase
MVRLQRALTLVLLLVPLSCTIRAAEYADGLAPPGTPASMFPTPSRPVAGIVTDTWHDEASRDRAGEAERVMNLLGVKPDLTVADIGAGSGYYTVRLARRVGPRGHVFAEDVVPEYLERLARRVAGEGLTSLVALVRGDPHDPRLPPGSLDLALLVLCTTRSSSLTGCYGTCARRCAPEPGVAVIDARKQTEAHGTPPKLLRCELAAVGYRQTAFYDLQESTDLAVFALPSPPAGPASPDAIRPCAPGRG